MKIKATTCAAMLFALAIPLTAFGQASMMTADHMVRVSKLIGTSVSNASNQTIGTVVDVLLTESGGSPNALLSVGSFVGGQKLVLVPTSELKFAPQTLTMSNGTKEHLLAMAAYDRTSVEAGGK